jgi:hypothetical protein
MPREDLIEAIKRENTKARDKARDSLRHCANCGEMLIALKTMTPHGTFMFVAAKRTQLPQRTINCYMSIARNWQHVATLKGIRDATEIIKRINYRPPPSSSRPPAVIDAEITDDEPQPLTQAEQQRLIELEGTIGRSLSDLRVAGVDMELETDDGPPVLTVDGTKDEPEPIASHHGHLDNGHLHTAQYYMDHLTLTELNKMFVWIEANRKRMIKEATIRQEQADLGRFAVELVKNDAATLQGERIAK